MEEGGKLPMSSAYDDLEAQYEWKGRGRERIDHASAKGIGEAECGLKSTKETDDMAKALIEKNEAETARQKPKGRYPHALRTMPKEKPAIEQLSAAIYHNRQHLARRICALASNGPEKQP